MKEIFELASKNLKLMLDAQSSISENFMKLNEAALKEFSKQPQVNADLVKTFEGISAKQKEILDLFQSAQKKIAETQGKEFGEAFSKAMESQKKAIEEIEKSFAGAQSEWIKNYWGFFQTKK